MEKQDHTKYDKEDPKRARAVSLLVGFITAVSFGAGYATSNVWAWHTETEQTEAEQAVEQPQAFGHTTFAFDAKCVSDNDNSIVYNQAEVTKMSVTKDQVRIGFGCSGTNKHEMLKIAEVKNIPVGEKAPNNTYVVTVPGISNESQIDISPYNRFPEQKTTVSGVNYYIPTPDGAGKENVFIEYNYS